MISVPVALAVWLRVTMTCALLLLQEFSAAVESWSSNIAISHGKWRKKIPFDAKPVPQSQMENSGSGLCLLFFFLGCLSRWDSQVEIRFCNATHRPPPRLSLWLTDVAKCRALPSFISRDSRRVWCRPSPHLYPSSPTYPPTLASHWLAAHKTLT